MNETTSVYADGAPTPVGPYPHARRVGPLLFLSGLGPRRPGSGDIEGLVLDGDGKVVSYDFEQQCRAVFRNVDAVLASAGSRRAALVDITVFLTDMRRDFETFNRLYGEWIGDAGPSRTTVEVSRLPTPIAIELKCIATTDDRT